MSENNNDFVITGILNEDGTELVYPANPLQEKWDNLYPPIRNGEPCGPILGYFKDGRPMMNYGCVLCCEEKCQHSSSWKCPEEDKEIYKQYMKECDEYFYAHNTHFSGIL